MIRHHNHSQTRQMGKELAPSLCLGTLLMASCGTFESSTAQVNAAQHSHEGSSHSHNMDLELYFPGALTEEATIVDCTLSDGSSASCYAISIAGYPANHEIGPFCPQTTASSAEDAGIWFDGDALYDMDGDFVLGLAELYDDSNWKLYDDNGNVRITLTPEAFEAAARPDVDPAYQNYCVEGRMDWLANSEPVQSTVLIPTVPVVAERVSTSRENLGVTLNGLVIAAPAPVNAILSAYTIAAFDDCGGHINPFEGYHLHGALGCSEVGNAPAGETPIFAYAMDGYAIHSPLQYDSPLFSELDQCGGHQNEVFGYHYHAAGAEKNGVLSCFVGLTALNEDNEPIQGNPGGPPSRGGQGRGGAPDLGAAAVTLGVSEHELMDVLGGPPPNFEEAAKALGVSVEVLREALAGERGR